jgi:hypothetical protein
MAWPGRGIIAMAAMSRPPGIAGGWRARFEIVSGMETEN